MPRVHIVNPLDRRYGSCYRARALMRTIWQNHPEAVYLEGLEAALYRNNRTPSNNVDDDRFRQPPDQQLLRRFTPLHYMRNIRGVVAGLPHDLLWIQKFLPLTAPLLWRPATPVAVDWDDLDAGLQKNWWRRLLVSACEHFLPPQVNVITTHSEVIAAQARRQRQPQVVVLPQTLDMRRFSTVAPDQNDPLEFRRPADRLVFAHLCSLNRGGAADLDVILEAFFKVARQSHNAFLLLIGGGEFEPHIHHRLRHLGLEHQVHLTGLQEQQAVTQLLRQSDFGLVFMRDNPANRARVSLKTLEYLAAGLPVIGRLVGESARLFNDKLSRSVHDIQDLPQALRAALAGEIERFDFSEEISHNWDLGRNLPNIERVVQLCHTASARSPVGSIST